MSSADLGELKSEQLGQLSTTQLKALSSSNLSALSSTQVAGLTTTQISALTTQQVKGLTADDIGELDADQLGALTSAQLGSLSTAALNALSSDVLGDFSTTQLKGLTAQQLGGLAQGDPVGAGVVQVRAPVVVLQSHALDLPWGDGASTQEALRLLERAPEDLGRVEDGPHLEPPTRMGMTPPVLSDRLTLGPRAPPVKGTRRSVVPPQAAVSLRATPRSTAGRRGRRHGRTAP